MAVENNTIGQYKLNSITVGDAQELVKLIPNNSIDLIFTDPPYKKEYIYLYGWLAEISARILKPGGFLCVMSGTYYLDKIFEIMSHKGLNWYFKIEVFNKHQAPIMWPRRIVTRTKPVLMWTKGKSVINIWNMTDVYQGQGEDKRYHKKLGQDVGSARYCIEYILGTGAKAILLDPFAGGGATLEACNILGINYIAFEIDLLQANIAQKRMEGILERKKKGK